MMGNSGTQGSDNEGLEPRRSSREKTLSEKGAAYLLERSLQQRLRCGKRLQQAQEELEAILQEITPKELQKRYSMVLNLYEQFCNQHALCQELLVDDEKSEDEKQNFF